MSNIIYVTDETQSIIAVVEEIPDIIVVSDLPAAVSAAISAANALASENAAQASEDAAYQYKLDAEAAAAAAAVFDPASVIITGGTINGVTIGGTNPGAATFTTAKVNDDLILATTKKFYVDGVAGVGGDSYITESSANIMDFFVGGINALKLTVAGAAVVGTFSATGVMSANAGVLIGDGSYAAGKIYTHPSYGLAITSKTGTINDLSITDASGNIIFAVPTGTRKIALSDVTDATSPSLAALTVAGGLGVSKDIIQAATYKFYLDGGGNTYLTESSADVLDLYAGGVNTLKLTASGAAVTGTLSATGEVTFSRIGDTTGSTLVLANASANTFESYSASASVDQKRWGWQAGSNVGDGIYRLRAFNDARTSGINAISISRSGIASVTLTLGGNTSVTGTLSATATNRPASFIATGTSGYTEYYKSTSTLVGSIGNGTGIVSAGGESNFGIRAEADLLFCAGGNSLKAALYSAGHFAIGSTAKLYLDGASATGDTYLVESSANVLNAYVGGAAILTLGTNYADFAGRVTSSVSGNSFTALGDSLATYHGTGGADSKRWDTTFSNTTMDMRLLNDANSLANSWLTVTRSGYTVSSIAFTGNTAVTGTLSATGIATADRFEPTGAPLASTVNFSKYASGAWINTPSGTAGYLATAGNMSLGFDANGVAIAATKKLFMDGVLGGGDTYIVESSSNVMDFYAGGVNTLRLTGSAAAVTGSLTVSSNALVAGGVRIDPSSGSTHAWLYRDSVTADRYWLASNWVGSQENIGYPSWGVLFDSRVVGDALSIQRAPAGGAMASVATFSTSGASVVGTIDAVKSGVSTLTIGTQGVTSGYSGSLKLDDTGMELYTNSANRGFRFNQNGTTTLLVTPSGAVILPTMKLWLDGAGDTYLVESAANTLTAVVGGNETLKMYATGVRISAADSSYHLAFFGATKGVRMGSGATGSFIQGVDNTLVGSYQPLLIGGSRIDFEMGGVTQFNTISGGIGKPATSSYLLLAGGITPSSDGATIYLCGSTYGTPNQAFIDSSQVNFRNISGAITYASVLSTGLAIPTAAKFYLDGTAGTGNTYIVESSADVMDFYAGGSNILKLTTGGAKVVTGTLGVGVDANAAIGVYQRATLTGLSTYAFAYDNLIGPGTTTAAYGVYVRPTCGTAAFTLANYYSFWAGDIQKGAGPTITNQYGLYVEALTNAGTNIGIRSLVAAGANNWNLYLDGTAKNYLGGDLALAATKKLYFDGVTGTGGDTYMVESAGNTLDTYVGGLKTLTTSPGSFVVTGVVDAYRAANDAAVIGRSESGVGDYQFLAEGRYSGYGAGIAMASRTSAGGTLVTMAKIVADGTASWNTTASTQDAQLSFHVANDGVLSQVGSWNYNYLTVAGHIIATAKSGGDVLVFTGSAGGSRTGYLYVDANYVAIGDTNSLTGSHFIVDKTNTQLIFQVGNAVKGYWTANGLAVNATQKLYLDGGGDTYFVEPSANTIDVYAGGVRTAFFTNAKVFGVGTMQALKHSNFGYSTAYPVVQLGLLGSNSAISLGVDVSGNPSAGFTGNEIVIPHTKAFIAPNAANTAFNTIFTVTDTGSLKIGTSTAGYVTDARFSQILAGSDAGGFYFAAGAGSNSVPVFLGNAGSTEIRMQVASGASISTYVAGVAKTAVVGSGLALVSTGKLYLDGIAGTGDTYLVESSANVFDLYTGGVNTLRVTSSGTAISGSGSGTFRVSSNADGAYVVGFSGVTKGVRFNIGATGTSIEGVDNTLTGSFQPIAIHGTSVQLQVSGAAIATVASTGMSITGITDSGDVVSTSGGVGLRIRYGATDFLNIFGSMYSSGATMLGYGVRSSTAASNTFLSTSAAASHPRGALVMDNALRFYQANASTIAVGSTATLNEAFTITTAGDMVTPATKKHFLDGVSGAGSDTYLVESSANILDVYAGGTKTLSLTTGGAAVTGAITATGQVFSSSSGVPFYASATADATTYMRITMDSAVSGTSYIAGCDADASNSVFSGSLSNHPYYIRVNNTSVAGFQSTGFALAATGKLYFDSVTGTGDTYLVESSANILDLYTGGTRAARFGASRVTFGAGIDVPYGAFNTSGDGVSKWGYFTAANSVHFSGTSTWQINDSANTKNLVIVRDSAPTNAFIVNASGISVPKTSGKGIQVDETWSWRDLEGPIQPKSGGAGSPTWKTWSGNVKEWAFIANDIVDSKFHWPHDWVPGTDVYIHVHWSHNGSAISGTFTMDHRHKWGKGHGQAVYDSEKTISTTASITNITSHPALTTFITEVQLSAASPSASQIDTDNLEADGLLKISSIVSALPTVTGGDLFIEYIDIHYQSSNVGTKNKAPGFFT